MLQHSLILRNLFVIMAAVCLCKRSFHVPYSIADTTDELYLVIVYLVSKTPLFKLFTEASTRLPHKIFLYLVFSSFCIMATYFGEQTHGAIANTRAMGAVLGGLLGGPTTGLLVGLTGGLHRYSLGGFTDLACAVSTTLEGLSAG